VEHVLRLGVWWSAIAFVQVSFIRPRRAAARPIAQRVQRCSWSTAGVRYTAAPSESKLQRSAGGPNNGRFLWPHS
jgi:hypothetical protein